MKIGSSEHKSQYCEELLKDYQEKIWKDELFLTVLADDQKKAGKKADVASFKTQTDEALDRIQKWNARIASVNKYFSSIRK